MSKRKPFDPMGTKYDMKTAVEAGAKPVLNPDDKKFHWQSLDPRTGMVLKGRRGSMKSWAAHELTEARMGANQVFKKGRYYTEGASEVKVEPKSNVEIKTKGSRDFKKQQYIDSIAPKNRG